MTNPILRTEKHQDVRSPELQLVGFGLPKDLIHIILRKLPLKDVVKCSLINKAMQQITFDIDLWKVLYLRDFDVQPPVENFSLETYKACHRYHSNIAKGVYALQSAKIGEGEEKLALNCKLIIAGDKCFGGFDTGEIKIWDSKTWECLGSFKGDVWGIRALILADGNLILGSCDGIIQVRNVETWGHVKTFEGHRNVGVLSFALDGETLISNDYFGTAKTWDRKEWNCLKTLERHRSAACSMMVDGQLFVGCSEGVVNILDLKTGKSSNLFEKEAKEGKATITSLVLAGERLILGNFLGRINIWDREQEICLHSPENEHSVLSLVWAEGVLFSLSKEGTIKIWDVERRVCLTTINVGVKSNYLAFTEGQLVISYHSGADFKILDFKAEDDEIFKEIAGSLRSADTGVVNEAMRRFCKMPKTAREKIYKELGPSGEDVFHNREGHHSTLEEKALAIESYLADRSSPLIAEPT